MARDGLAFLLSALAVLGSRVSATLNNRTIVIRLHHRFAGRLFQPGRIQPVRFILSKPVCDEVFDRRERNRAFRQQLKPHDAGFIGPAIK